MFDMIEKVTSKNKDIPTRIVQGAEILARIYLAKKPKHKQYSAMVQAASLYIYGIANYRCQSHGSGRSREVLGKWRLLQWDLAQDLDCTASAIYTWTQKVITSLTPYEMDIIFTPHEIENLAYNKLLKQNNAVEYDQFKIPTVGVPNTGSKIHRKI